MFYARVEDINMMSTLSSHGQIQTSASISLCKSDQGCPLTCPSNFNLQDGAVYTVGERIHLLLKSTPQAVSETSK